MGCAVSHDLCRVNSCHFGSTQWNTPALFTISSQLFTHRLRMRDSNDTKLYDVIAHSLRHDNFAQSWRHRDDMHPIWAPYKMKYWEVSMLLHFRIVHGWDIMLNTRNSVVVVVEKRRCLYLADAISIVTVTVHQKTLQKTELEEKPTPRRTKKPKSRLSVSQALVDQKTRVRKMTGRTSKHQCALSRTLPD